MWKPTLNPLRLRHYPTQKVQNSSLVDDAFRPPYRKVDGGMSAEFIAITGVPTGYGAMQRFHNCGDRRVILTLQ